jgi:hypothetical protein
MSRQNRSPQHSSVNKALVRKTLIADAFASGLFALAAAGAGE